MVASYRVIKGDGNCQFRALQLAQGQNEEDHLRLRLQLLLPFAMFNPRSSPSPATLRTKSSSEGNPIASLVSSVHSGASHRCSSRRQSDLTGREAFEQCRQYTWASAQSSVVGSSGRQQHHPRRLMRTQPSPTGPKAGTIAGTMLNGLKPSTVSTSSKAQPLDDDTTFDVPWFVREIKVAVGPGWAKIEEERDQLYGQDEGLFKELSRVAAFVTERASRRSPATKADAERVYVGSRKGIHPIIVWRDQFIALLALLRFVATITCARGQNLCDPLFFASLIQNNAHSL